MTKQQRDILTFGSDTWVVCSDLETGDSLQIAPSSFSTACRRGWLADFSVRGQTVHLQRLYLYGGSVTLNGVRVQPVAANEADPVVPEDLMNGLVGMLRFELDLPLDPQDWLLAKARDGYRRTNTLGDEFVLSAGTMVSPAPTTFSKRWKLLFSSVRIG